MPEYFTYTPAEEATLKSPWDVAHLSNRDLSADVPISYVPAPAVSISKACLARDDWQARSTTLCISNLLSMGFRHLFIDLYWDHLLQIWTLHPILSPPFRDSCLDSGLAPDRLPDRITGPPVRSERNGKPLDIADRHATSAKPSEPEKSNPQLRNPSTSTPVPQDSDRIGSTRRRQAEQDQVQGGAEVKKDAKHPLQMLADHGRASNLSCMPTQSMKVSSQLSLDGITHLLEDYFEKTSNNIDANLLMISLSLKMPEKFSDIPREDLPQKHHSVASIIGQKLFKVIYTPTLLEEDRSNLNLSWYGVSQNSLQPDAPYLYIQNDQGEHQTFSREGWTGTGYLEMTRALRLLVGYVRIDPRLEYDHHTDSELIFGPESLVRWEDIGTSGPDRSLNTCLSQTNSSPRNLVNHPWALTPVDWEDADIKRLRDLFQRIICCGSSPMLNTSLRVAGAVSTADRDPWAFTELATTIIWSWAPGEPRLTDDKSAKGPSQGSEQGSGSTASYQCAALSVGLSGRWVSMDCEMRLPVACRKSDSPYEWEVSGTWVTYKAARDSCPEGTTFRAPSTALENWYLNQFSIDYFKRPRKRDGIATGVGEKSAGGRPGSEGGELMKASAGMVSNKGITGEADGRVWVDFNSLSYPNCWVTGNLSSCPYTDAEDLVAYERELAVPLFSALIIFVIAGLTIFAKCASNRRRSRRGRTRLKGREEHFGEYDGIPA